MDSGKISNNTYKKLGVTKLEEISKGAIKTDIILNEIKKFVSKKEKILELACGYGRVTIPLFKQGYDVCGVDLAPNLITEAKLRAKKSKLNINFKIGDMRDLPYEDESFDKIFCMWSSFSHLLTEKDQIKTINEVYRVLRNGGAALFEIVNGEKRRFTERIKKEGRGKNGRLLTDTFFGVKAIQYVHDRKTLNNICSKSRANNFNIKFKNIMGRRRIIMWIYK